MFRWAGLQFEIISRWVGLPVTETRLGAALRLFRGVEISTLIFVNFIHLLEKTVSVLVTFFELGDRWSINQTDGVLGLSDRRIEP